MSKAENWFNDAVRQLQAGDGEAAGTLLKKVLRKQPKNVAALVLLARIHCRMGTPDAGIPLFNKALAVQPGHPEASLELSRALERKGSLTRAAETLEQACGHHPDHPVLLNKLAMLRQRLGDLDGAARAFEHAARQPEDHGVALRNSLGLACFRTDLSPEEVAALHRKWGDLYLAHMPKLPPASHRNPADPERVIRVGYLSADFRQHAVAHFILPLLEGHTKGVEVTAYADVPRPDRMTERMRGTVARWRDIAGQPDAEVADRIRADGIDILVELSGHTTGSRLTVLAHRPAPVQVSYLGHPCTTGLSSVDYRITDALADPPGVEHCYTEKLVRVPLFFCYRPREDSPAVAPAPCRQNGYVTFGSLINLTKLNPRVIAYWSQVLAAVPDARLFLFRNTLQEKAVRERILAAFGAHGVDAGRITLEGRPVVDGSYLEMYGRFDVALDTLPFCGHTSILEGLWMGVPTLTLPGSTFVGRMGACVMTALGHPELIAETETAFVEKAAELAADPEHIARMRRGLRDRMAASPLCDGRAFAGNLEDAYRKMWRDWCATRRGE